MSWAKWLGVSEGESLETLLDTLSWCHQQSTLHNNNASGVVLANAAFCNATFEHSVAAALLTLGSKHGPVMAARDAIYIDEDAEIISKLEDGALIPGWGNSFHKKSIDPAFVSLDHLLREEYPGHHEHLDRIAKLIFKVKGKSLYPNPAAYSAVCAEIIGLARGTESLLFIACRLPAWSKQFISVAS